MGKINKVILRLAIIIKIMLLILNQAIAAEDDFLIPAYFTSAGIGQSGDIVKVSIQELDGVTTVNYPFMFSHIFKQGDCKDNLTVRINGNYVPTQTDVKVRYEDGSVKQALISCVIPKLDAGALLTVTLVNGGINNNTDFVTREQLLNTNFDCKVNFNIGGQNYSISAGGILNKTEFTAVYWLKGAIATEFLLNDVSLNPHQQLNIKYNVRVFPGWDGMRVFLVVENVWGDYRGNLDYDVLVEGGHESSVSLFQKSAIKHNVNSRWCKEFWLGKTPSRINIKYDLKYLIATGLIPNYDTSLTVSETVIAGQYSQWKQKNIEIMGNGFLTKYFPTTGGRQERAIYPGWTARYLLSMDWRMRDITIGHGYLSGAIPIHMRESDKNRPFYGHIISIDDRPTVWLGNESYQWTKAEDRLPSPIGITDTDWTVDRAHQPSLAYVPYIVTGDYYFLEEMYFWAGWDLGCSNYSNSYRDYAKGLIRDQVRGEAWAIRNIADAEVLASDGDIEKNYFNEKINNNITSWEEKYIKNNFHPLHTWGYISCRLQDGGRPYNEVVDTVRHTSLPWQDDYVLICLGHMKEQGFATENLVNWLGEYVVNRFSHPDLNHFHGAAYKLPATYTQTPEVMSPYYNYQTWKEVEQACTDNPTTWMYPDLAIGYQFNARAALSFVKHLPNFQQAWDFINNNADSVVLNSDPTWALIPREIESIQSDINGDGAVNVLDVQLCVNVVLGIEAREEIVNKARQITAPLGECNVLDIQAVVNVILNSV